MSEFDVENTEPVENGAGNEPKPDKPSMWVWFAVSGLFFIALAVIFVLPSIVDKYEMPLERRADVAVVLNQEALNNTAVTISPFEEAQRSIQRKEAQDVLAELLANQAELDALNVEDWSLEDYESALEQASIGDEYYRTQDFILARDSYGLGRDALSVLQQTVPVVLERTLIEAQQAFDQLRSTEAEEKYALALLLAPDNDAAEIGLYRAQLLDEVNELFASADEYVQLGELEQAEDAYRQIVSLDSYNQLAREKLEQLSAEILENEFANIMSAGYVLLERQQDNEAIEQFRRASNLGINQDQALAAITQTENEIANTQISELSVLISSSQQQENWQAAVDDYGKVLEIDSNLTFAINGKEYAQKRARLDSLLIDALNNPERFAEDSVFQQTLDVYYTGRAIENPGPHLVEQLDELEALLESSQLPIDIQLYSDSVTDVTLLRVEHLGVFEETAISLKPGRYVAVGKRSGFREVRKEFTVGFGQTPESVLIQCDEPIVAANRR